MTRKIWPSGVVVVLALAVWAGVHFWTVRKPPRPAAAVLPASARILLQPYRKDGIDLKLAAGGELQYRVAMEAGATLVYSWSANNGPVACQFADQKPARAREAHGAFVAQSSGWYRWHWSNPANDPVKIHLKLSGYYEPTVLPPAGMPYDR